MKHRVDKKVVIVAAAVIEHNGKILIAHRREADHGTTAWEFPGGKVKACESVETCLIREVKEELNVTIAVGCRLADFTHVYPEGPIRLIAHRATIMSGKITLKDHDEVVWVDMCDLGQYRLMPADEQIASTLIAHG